MDEELMTWRRLGDAIASMPEDRKDDPVQIWRPDWDGDKTLPLETGIGFNTVEYFGGGSTDYTTRSSIDNEHHPEHYCILTDQNPFSEDGDFSYLLTDDGWVGDKTGKLLVEKSCLKMELSPEFDIVLGEETDVSGMSIEEFIEYVVRDLRRRRMENLP